MKKASVIALCVVLAAALIFAFVLYRNYGEKKRELALCEEENKALNRKLGETAEETAAAEAELIEKANARISGLEQAMENTRQNYAGLEEALRKLRLEADERESAIETLEEALAVKETDLRDATANFEATRMAMEKRLRECNRELSMVKENVSELQVALEAGQKSAFLIEEDLRRVKTGSGEKDRLIKTLSEELQEKERSFAKTRQMQEDEILALKRELSEKDKGLAETRGKLEQELVALQKEIEKEKEELAKFQESLSNVKGEKESLEHRLAQTKSTHTAMLAGLEQEIRNKEITIQELKEKFSITFVDQVLFESGKAALTPRGKEILSKVSGVLMAAESRYIRVVGHTDNKPILPEYRYKYPSNWELSAARAAMVVRFFQDDMGLDPVNLEAAGRSFYEPVAGNDTEKGRALNRRVDIVIAPKID